MNENLKIVKNRLASESSFWIDDKPLVFKNLISNTKNYLTWEDVETCLNNPAFYNFEIIDKNSNEKIFIPGHNKCWVRNKLVQDKKFVVEKFLQGNSLIINNYEFYNKNNQELLQLIESIFHTYSSMHVYCGLEGSKSFPIHEDTPANFIFQIEGDTEWVVFENRASSVVKPVYDPTDIELSSLKVSLQIILEPGDFLYIPSRCYHLCKPSKKRLSISIPCWPKFEEPKEYSLDRNYYSILN